MICGVQRTVIDNRYEISYELGGGGMARVYLARDEVLSRNVALKILRGQFAEDAEFAERFKREAQSAASLTHPNIVSVFDRGESEDGTAYIAMEHVGGGTLKERITRDGALDAEEATRLALQITDALGLAHRKGVIHRDIKPHNVLLTESENAKPDAKVTDFGIARAASSTTISQTSRVMGTASYMSPEQALGKSLDHRTDLYSLGVVLYEMLTGELPHAADNPVAVSMKHVNDTPRSPTEVNPGVPRDLDAVTMKLLEKDPDDRYRSASELARDLRRVREGQPLAIAGAGVREETRPQPTRAIKPEPPPPRRRNGVLRGVTALMLVLLVLLGGWALSRPIENFGLQDAPGEEAARVEVPEVIGQSRAEAQQELESAGFGVRFREQESSAAQDGAVLRQSPGSGDRVREGSTVTLTVGSGPSLAEVPDIVGSSGVEAKAALERAGLLAGSVSRLPSATYEAGVISEQGIEAGASVPRGTAVSVALSTGPVPIPEDAPENNPQSSPGRGDAVELSTASPRPALEQQVPEQRAPDQRVPDQRVPEQGADPQSSSGPGSGRPAQVAQPGGEIEDDGSGISGSGEVEGGDD